MTYFVVEQTNGKLHHIKYERLPPTNTQRQKDGSRQGSILEVYELRDDQALWSIPECQQAMAFGMLKPYTAPASITPPPDCWAKLRLDPGVPHSPGDVETAYAIRMAEVGGDTSLRLGMKRARGHALRLIAQQ